MSLKLDKSTWMRVAFGDVVRNVNETVKNASGNGIDRVIAMEHMDPGELKIERWGDLADETTFTRRVRPGQTLFGKRRAYQRKVAYAEFDAICSGDIYTFVADETRMLGEFLPFLVQSDSFFEHALATSAGSLSPRTNWRELADFAFDLPPLEVQRQVVGLLTAVEGHARALKQSREIVTELLSAQANSLFDRHKENLVRLRTVGATSAQSVQVGPFGRSLSSRHFTESGTRVLKIQNITDDGSWDLDHAVYVADQYASTLERYMVQADDLIFAAQATVGRCALAPKAIVGALISQHLIRVRLDRDKALPAFMHAMALSTGVQDQMRAIKTKTTRDGLNTADVENFEVPIPTMPEQIAFVELREQGVSAIEAITRELHDLMQVRRETVGRFFGGN